MTDQTVEIEQTEQITEKILACYLDLKEQLARGFRRQYEVEPDALYSNAKHDWMKPKACLMLHAARFLTLRQMETGIV